MKFSSPALLLSLCVGCSSTAEKSPTPSTVPADSGNPITHNSLRVPNFTDVTEICVNAGGSPGWVVRIWRDGDGCLVGSPILAATFPRGTFDLRQVYDSLAGGIESTRPIGDFLGVSFVTVTEPGYASTFYTRDEKAVQLIFDTAKQHCVTRDADGFEKIWSERPPFPK